MGNFQPIIVGNNINNLSGPATYFFLDFGPGISLTQSTTDYRRYILTFNGAASSVYVDGITIIGAGTQASPFSVGLVPISKGGTGITTTPLLGQMLVANSSGAWNYQTLNAGANVTITFDASTGQPTISATGGGGGGNTFDPAFFTDVNNFVSIADAGATTGITSQKIKSLDFTKITNIPYNIANGILRLNNSGIADTAQLPSASSTGKGIVQIDGSTIIADSNTVISVGNIKTSVYNYLKSILTAGTQITLLNNDTNQTITISSGGSGGASSGGTTVIFTPNPGSSQFPTGAPYIVNTTFSKDIAIPIPLYRSTNSYFEYSGNGKIGTVTYIDQINTFDLYGNSLLFPTSLVVNKYNAYVKLENINTTVRITSPTAPDTSWITEIAICPKSIIAGRNSPLADANAWSIFRSGGGSENDIINIVYPNITVQAVSGQTNQWDVNFSGGVWYMAALSETNGYIGSNTEYILFLVARSVNNIPFTAVTVPTPFDNFTSGLMTLTIDLIGASSGPGPTYVPSSPKGTISITGAESSQLDIAQQSATDGQVLAWNSTLSKYQPKTLSNTQVQTDYALTDNTLIAFLKNKPSWASGSATPPISTDGNIYIKYNRDANNIPIDINLQNNVNGTWSINNSVTDLIESLSYNIIKNVSLISLKGAGFDTNLDVDNLLGTKTSTNTTSVVVSINKGLVLINLSNITIPQDQYFQTRYFANSTVQFNGINGTFLINILSYNKFSDNSGQIVASLDNNTTLYNQAITTFLSASGGVITNNSTINITNSTTIVNLFGASGNWNSSILNSYVTFGSGGILTPTQLPIATASTQGILSVNTTNNDLAINNGVLSLSNALTLLSLLINGQNAFLRLQYLTGAPFLSTDSLGNVISTTLPIATSSIKGIISVDTTNSNLTINNGVLGLSNAISLLSLIVGGTGSFLRLSNILSSNLLGTDENGNIVSKSLPIATADNLGGVKVGTGLSVLQDGTINVTQNPSNVQIKALADIATLSNITLSGLQTIQGITLTAASRVVVTGQTNANDNGIYNPGVSSWTRTTDALTISLISNALIAVNKGDNAGDSFYCTNTNTGTIGNVPINFIISSDINFFNVVNGGLTAGYGLSKRSQNNQVLLTLNAPTSVTQLVGLDGLGAIVKATLPASATVVGTDANSNIIAGSLPLASNSQKGILSIAQNSNLILTGDTQLAVEGSPTFNSVSFSTSTLQGAKVLGTSPTGSIIDNSPVASAYLIGTDANKNFVGRKQVLANWASTTTVLFEGTDLLLAPPSGGTGLVDINRSSLPFSYSSGTFTYTGSVDAFFDVQVMISVITPTSTTVYSIPTVYIAYNNTTVPANRVRIAQANTVFIGGVQYSQLVVFFRVPVSASTTAISNKFGVYYWNNLSANTNVVGGSLAAGNACPFSNIITVSGIV